MTTHYRGPFLNERQVGKWEDCVAASGVNIYNGVHKKWPGAKAAPITDAEREALRIAGRDTSGGMTLVSLADGMERRYGHRPRASSDWDLLLAPKGGDVRWWVVQGKYSALPAHFRRWSPNGTFWHACAVGPGDKTGERWWYDPLSSDGYNGEPITMPALRAFMKTMQYTALSYAEEDALPPPIIVLPPPPSTDLTPYSQADLDAAVAAEHQQWLDWLATHPVE